VESTWSSCRAPGKLVNSLMYSESHGAREGSIPTVLEDRGLPRGRRPDRSMDPIGEWIMAARALPQSYLFLRIVVGARIVLLRCSLRVRRAVVDSENQPTALFRVV